MNDTFNFKRFWTYFKYDLKQMWRNHSKAAMLIGGASAIFYILWVMFSLVFAQRWTSPLLPVRVVVLFIAFAILELYQVRTYGHLTDKKAGSAWLMVPASRLEKYLSMLLITLIVIPFLFFAVYFILDGILSLVDPTYGTALFTGFMGAYRQILDVLSTVGNASPITLTPSNLLFPMIVSFFCNFLYFLLCGICFKKNKLVIAIAILFGVSILLSLVSGVIVPLILLKDGTLVELSEEQLLHWTTGVMNATVALTCLLTVGLGWGVWRRIKTLQH